MKPRFLILDGPFVCNQHCEHCDSWRKNPAAQAREQNEWRVCWPLHEAIIRDFASFAEPGSALVPCGGEPLLFMERLRLVREVTSELGLRVLVVTNGTVVTNTVKAREALALVDDISVSFDDYRSFLHDALRGGTGSFNRAKEAVRYLSSVRNGQKLYLMCLVHRSNLDCLVRFFDLAVELGADRAKLNFLMPTFGRNKGTDGFFQLNAPTSSRDFLASLRAIEAKHGIVPNPLWVDARVSYLDGLASSPNLAVGWSGNIGSLKPICGAWERNVHVDRHGVMRLCWGPEFPSRKWERPGDVKRFWTETPRECYQLCHKACGVSHSVHRDSFSRG